LDIIITKIICSNNNKWIFKTIKAFKWTLTAKISSNKITKTIKFIINKILPIKINNREVNNNNFKNNNKIKNFNNNKNNFLTLPKKNSVRNSNSKEF